jgi:hypothetical protein
MPNTFDEIDRLAQILHNEAEGLPVNRDLARSLAEYLAETCPEMRSTMERIRRRMAA